MQVGDIFPWFSVAALMVAGVSPVAVGIYSHRARRNDAATERQRRKDERDADDHRRRDEEQRRGEVAAKALEIAQELVGQSRELNQSTSEKVTAITEAVHSVLPNGNVTAAMESELNANRSALQAMQETAKLKEKAGIPVLPDEYERIAALKLQVEALNAQIYNRKHSK